MPIDDKLEEMGKKDELERLRKQKAEAVTELKRQRLDKEKLKAQLDEYKKQLEEVHADKEYEILKAHLRGMSNFWPGEPKDEVDEAVIKLVSLPNFIDIYRNALAVKNIVPKMEYILMMCLENKVCYMSIDKGQFFSCLAPLGLNLVCPYFESMHDSQQEFDRCAIDGKPTDALCHGRHDFCSTFKEKTAGFVTGEAEYVEPLHKYKAPKLLMSEKEKRMIENKIIQENEKFWRE